MLIDIKMKQEGHEALNRSPHLSIQAKTQTFNFEI